MAIKHFPVVRFTSRGREDAQRRQSGSSYNAESHHSPSRWRVDVQNSTPKCMAR